MLQRRTFLKSALALPALSLATVPSAWAAPSERLTLGFIGVGTMGSGHHLKRLLKRADVEVVGICDVVQERIQAAVKLVKTAYKERKKSGKWSGPQTFTDFRRLLELPGLDAVVIATPDHWHTIPCLLAARAGKHIYCEKPLTHHIDEGKRLVEEVRRAGVTFQTGSQQRSEFDGRFRKAVEYIWNGRIGRIKTVRIAVGGSPQPCQLPTQPIPPGTDWDMWLGPAPQRGYHEELCPKGVHKHFPAWRNYVEFAGGGLADMGAHHFDIAQWALQLDRSGPVEIQPPTDPNRSQGLRFLYADGTVMIHDEFEPGIKADCVFEGTDGMILVSRGEISSRPESILAEPLTSPTKRILPSSDHHENWIQAIRTGTEAICPVEVGHRSASICHLANIGYRLRRPLKWDPALETFPHDPEANRQLTREARGEWKQI